MNSPDLLLLVENCPKGAETLVTRCLHILTDKGTAINIFGFFCLLAAINVLKLLFIVCFQSHRLQTWWREYGISITNEFQMCVSSSRSSMVWKRSFLFIFMLTPSSLINALSVTVILYIDFLIAHLLYLTERGDPGIAQTNQTQPHSSQGGLQSPARHTTQ